MNPAEEGKVGGARRPSPTSVGAGGSPDPLVGRMAVLLRCKREDEEQPPAGEVKVGGPSRIRPTLLPPDLSRRSFAKPEAILPLLKDWPFHEKPLSRHSAGKWADRAEFARPGKQQETASRRFLPEHHHG